MTKLNILIFLTLASLTGCFSYSPQGDNSGGKLFENHHEVENSPSFSNTLSTSFIKPVDAIYSENSKLIFQINFDGLVTVSGSPRLSLTIGAMTEKASFVSGNNTSSLIFEYIVKVTDQDLDGIDVVPEIELNEGSIKDIEGVNITPNLSDLVPSHTGVIIDSTTGVMAPGKVDNLTSAPTTNNTELSLSWSKPADNGSIITHYELQYRKKETTDWILVSPAPTTNSKIVTNLELGSIYEVRVAANNGLIGEYSDSIEVEIFDIQALNPIAWLDANNVNGNGTFPDDGDKVSAWVDLTSTATDATEVNVANQPTFKTNIQNGLPAIRFLDHDRGLEGSFNRTVGNDFTFIIVGQFDTGSVDKAMFEFQGNGGSARGFFIDRRYASNTHFSPTTTKGAFQIWSIEDNGTSSIVKENDLEIFNGTNTFHTDFIGTGTYVLGDDITGGNRLSGFIGEFLIFDKALTAKEMQQLKTYLKNKWNTP